MFVSEDTGMSNNKYIQQNKQKDISDLFMQYEQDGG